MRAAFLIMLLSELGYAGMSLFLKLASAQHRLETGVALGPWEATFVRSSIMLLVSASLVFRARDRMRGSEGGLGWSLFRGVAGTVGLVTFYQASLSVPMAVVTVFGYLKILVAVVLAGAFLGERLSMPRLACITLSCAGVLLVLLEPVLAGGPTVPSAMGGTASSGQLAALTSGITTGLVLFALRKTKHLPWYVTMLPFALFGTALSAARLWQTGLPAGSTVWGFILLSGASGFLAQLFVTLAVARAPLPSVVLAQFAGTALSAGLGYLLLGETLLPAQALGCGFILVFSVLLPMADGIKPAVGGGSRRRSRQAGEAHERAARQSRRDNPDLEEEDLHDLAPVPGRR